MTLHQGLAFGLILCAIAGFVWGRFRYDVVSLTVLVAGVAIGVVPPAKAFDGFKNEIVIIIGSALVVSAAVARSGVVEMVMRPLLSRFRTEQGQVPVLVASTSMLAMVTKNVGALAMLMPVAITSARKVNSSPSRVLMPMSFASLLGGIVTLIGTSPNIIVSEVRQDSLGKPFGMFDFTPVGLCLTALGVVFLSFAYRLLPKDRQGAAGLGEAMEANVYVTEVEAPADWPEGRTVADLKLGGRDVKLTALLHAGERIVSPLPDAVVRAGDVIMLQGEQAMLDEAVSGLGLKLVRSDRPVDKSEASEDILTAEGVIAPDSVLIGRSARRLALREQFGANLIAVSRGGERIAERLRNLTLQAGDVLVLQAGERALPGVMKSLGVLPLATRDLALGSLRRRIAPPLILAVAMVLVALKVVPISMAFFGAAVAMVLCGALTMREAYGSLDAPVLVLIAALVPVSEAVRDSGGAALVGGWLAHLLAVAPPLLAVGLILVSSMACAPFLHNVPTVLVLGPIAVALAQRLHLNPDPFLMGVATGAACDFLTPIGHQCNTLVMGPGGYRFGDYWKLGAPLSLLVIFLGTPLIVFFWPFQ